ncbi:MAG TPA: DNRLRE domain-containing protein, partial [Candidatus Bathyarchaeia archaeon]|nr:DNRLRE domain-containing protein [Candidatus Bathyarchaeia archaeon]
MGVAKIKPTLVFIIFFSYFSLALPVFAQTNPSPSPKGLLPEKDTYVNSAYPNDNFGQKNQLSAGFTSSSNIIFLKFNFEQFPESQLNQGKKAILNLYLSNSTGETKPIEVELLLPKTDWEENELNWNNKPSLYSSGLTTQLEATPGAQKIDLTDLVKQWLTNETENRGVAFYHNLENFSRTFCSKEDEKKPPYLTFEEPTPSGKPQILNQTLNEGEKKGLLALEIVKTKV